MPEFILPAEADHCPYCGEVLRDPPNCCEPMKLEHSQLKRWEQEDAEREQREAERAVDRGEWD